MTPLPALSFRAKKKKITVNARLLHTYVSHPAVSYENWVESLRDMLIVLSRFEPCRIRIGADGELALNYEFAFNCACAYATDLMRAIAVILIEEGRHGAV